MEGRRALTENKQNKQILCPGASAFHLEQDVVDISAQHTAQIEERVKRAQVPLPCARGLTINQLNISHLTIN